jgi:hypothetical protein
MLPINIDGIGLAYLPNRQTLATDFPVLASLRTRQTAARQNGIQSQRHVQCMCISYVFGYNMAAGGVAGRQSEQRERGEDDAERSDHCVART